MKPAQPGKRPRRKPGTNKHGLPTRCECCECGGKMTYQYDFGRWWSGCKSCTPVVRINLADYRRLVGKGGSR